MIGEVGGEQEEDAAHWLAKNNHRNLPVVGYIAGLEKGKIKALEKSGVIVVDNVSKMGDTMALLISQKRSEGAIL